jgi:hypothetical protein
MHDVLKTVIGENYYGPVEDDLAEDPDQVKSVGMQVIRCP